MTKDKPTSETQNSPKVSDCKKTPAADATGFFNRVRRELNSEEEEEPTHPSEAAEIVVTEEGE